MREHLASALYGPPTKYARPRGKMGMVVFCDWCYGGAVAYRESKAIAPALLPREGGGSCSDQRTEIMLSLLVRSIKATPAVVREIEIVGVGSDYERAK